MDVIVHILYMYAEKPNKFKFKFNSNPNSNIDYILMILLLTSNDLMLFPTFRTLDCKQFILLYFCSFFRIFLITENLKKNKRGKKGN